MWINKLAFVTCGAMAIWSWKLGHKFNAGVMATLSLVNLIGVLVQ